MKHNYITPDRIKKLYDPKESGVIILHEVVNGELRNSLLRELRANNTKFVGRPIHYGTTLQDLSSWDMEREEVTRCAYLSELSSIYDEISGEIHSSQSNTAHFDDINVNSSLYLSGSLGIGPHRDNSFSVNFVAIFVISGNNNFYTADDKSGSGEVIHYVRPGDCIVMRGPRLDSEGGQRPIHYVKKITADRYIVTFREINQEYLRRVHKDGVYNI